MALAGSVPAQAFGPPADPEPSPPAASDAAEPSAAPTEQPSVQPGDGAAETTSDQPSADPGIDAGANPTPEGAGAAPTAQPESGPQLESGPEPPGDGGPDDGAGDGKDDDTSTLEGITIPRVDGAYFGATFAFDLSFTSVLDLETPDPFLTGLGLVQVGQSVLPWLYLGVTAGGGGGSTANGQLTYHGGFVVSGGLYPVPKYPFSVRLGLGFGAGAVTDPDETARFGFGGAIFQGAVRYEFFPLAKTLRPRRGGGWAIGPELGWLGYTPAAAGQPFTNNVYLGISTGFYFGT